MEGIVVFVYMAVGAGTIYATFRAAQWAAAILSTRIGGKLRNGLGISLLVSLVLSYIVLIAVCWLGGWYTLSALRGETLPSEQAGATVRAYPSPTPVPGLTGARTIFQFASVTRVIDGETIEVSMGGNAYLVRYLGISVPAADATCQSRAKAMNVELVENQQVRLETDINSPDTDSEGRFLRYVYVGSLCVNAALIEKGYAVTSPSPLLIMYARFAALETQARSARVGCYAP